MKFFVISVLLFYSFTTFSGEISSGGGNAIVCYSNDHKTITKAHLLDLYEGRSIFGDIHNDNKANSIEELLQLAKNRLALTGYNVWGPYPRIEDRIKFVYKNMNFIAEGDRLKPSTDSYEVIIPKDCEVARVAAFFDASRIVVDKRIWDAFAELDKASLILHEAIYWFDRSNGKPYDSRRSRRVVSLLMQSNWKFEDVKEGLPKSYYICSNIINDGKPFTMFAVYKKDRFDILQFFALGGDFMVSKKILPSIGFPYDENSNVDTYMGGPTYSNYEGGDNVKIRRQPIYNEGKVFGTSLSIKGVKPSYPKNEIDEIQLSCHLVE